MYVAMIKSAQELSNIGEKDFRRIFEFHNDYLDEEPENF